MKLDAVQKAAQEQFSRQSGQYGQGHILQDVSDVQAAVEQIPLQEGSRVLDVATGGGHTGLYLASLGHQVILADIAAPMLEKAVALGRLRGVTAEARLHAAEELPYASGTFDLVTCRVAAHHFSSPSSFVQEAARVLASDGYLLVIDGSVPDGQPEAEEWLHQVEKLRDPSHGRFLSPKKWGELCNASGLTVIKSELTPFKQPDLEWYFTAADTSPANREAVRKLVADAPDSAREAFKLGLEETRVVWWWPRLTLIARKG